MPCYTRTVTNSNVEKWNEVRAREAIKQAGFGYLAFFANGKLTIGASSKSELDAVQKAIVQKYSELVIRDASKRFGWTVTQTTKTQAGLTQMNLRR
jgi:hypothetical protein